MNAFRARDLFQALDGRSLSVSSSQWLIEMYGVFEQQGSYWVQLALRGPSDYSVAVKISPRDTEIQVLEALSMWVAEPSDTSGRVLSLG